MSTISKQELLKRIGVFLDMPGVCLPEKRQEILAMCENLSNDQLAEVSASLRIRVRSLIKMAQSDDVKQAINSTKQQLDSLLKKYAVQS